MIDLTKSSPTLTRPFNPNKISLFSTSGLKPKPELFISAKLTLIPASLIAPIAFAIFV